MATDPNARRDSLLKGILDSVNETNKLLKAQNKILEKVEKHGTPAVITSQHPYLKAREPTLPGAVPPSDELHEGPYGVGPSQTDR